MLRFTVKKPKKGIFDVSIIAHRERVAKVEPMLKPADVPFFDMLVPISEGVKIPTRIYLPPQGKAPLATLFYIPGTAFVAHESRVTQVICSHICRLAGCQVIVINHRLAPENPAPVPHLDSYEVFRFFVQKKPIIDQFSIDKSRIALAGYSSGGNIAASMAIKAKQDGIHILRQVLISPIVDLSRSLKSFLKYEQQDSDISEEFVNWFLDLCLPENVNPKDPEISPFWVSKEIVQGLPPTTIVVAEYDRFRSDAELYYKKLLDGGVDVEKLFLDKENHSYLWHKLEIVEKIAENVLKPAFAGGLVERPITTHRLLYIKPTVQQSSSLEGSNDNHQNLKPIFRSKL